MSPNACPCESLAGHLPFCAAHDSPLVSGAAGIICAQPWCHPLPHLLLLDLVWLKGLGLQQGAVEMALWRDRQGV
jgi:hypothetical protein